MPGQPAAVPGLDGEAVRHYVARTAERLAAQLDPAPPSYKISLVDGGFEGVTAEAAAIPGGYILVPAELIRAADSEAEFVAALAHAIAHLAAGHAPRTPLVMPSTGPQLPLPPVRRTFADRIHFTEEDERVADLLVVRMLAGAGFDPRGLAALLTRTEADHGRERLAAVQTLLDAQPVREYPESADFSRIQEELWQQK